jgi:SHS2 domain-containing protein
MNSRKPEAEQSLPGLSQGYFDHDADIGIIGRGTTVEQAFEAAGQAVFGIVTNLDMVRPSTSVAIEFEEADPEFALVTWLNLLLGKARELGMVFCRFRVEHLGNHWRAEALGENWRPDLERGVEVKGATLTMLSVEKTGAMWQARCVVDV